MSKKIWLIGGMIAATILIAILGVLVYQRMNADAVTQQNTKDPQMSVAIVADKPNVVLDDIVTYKIQVKKLKEDQTRNNQSVRNTYYLTTTLADGSAIGKTVNWAIERPVLNQVYEMSVPVKIVSKAEGKKYYDFIRPKVLRTQQKDLLKNNDQASTNGSYNFLSVVYASSNRYGYGQYINFYNGTSYTGATSITISPKVDASLKLTKKFSGLNSSDVLAKNSLTGPVDVNIADLQVKDGDILQGEITITSKSTSEIKTAVPTNCSNPRIMVNNTSKVVMPSEKTCDKKTTDIVLAAGASKSYPVTIVIGEYKGYESVDYSKVQDILAFDPKAVYWLDLSTNGKKTLGFSLGDIYNTSQTNLNYTKDDSKAMSKAKDVTFTLKFTDLLKASDAKSALSKSATSTSLTLKDNALSLNKNEVAKGEAEFKNFSTQYAKIEFFSKGCTKSPYLTWDNNAIFIGPGVASCLSANEATLDPIFLKPGESVKLPVVVANVSLDDYRSINQDYSANPGNYAFDRSNVYWLVGSGNVILSAKWGGAATNTFTITGK